MTDFHSTLDAIDRATGCQQCEGPLGSSPSGDFCGEFCQQRWAALRVGADLIDWGGIPIIQEVIITPPTRSYYAEALMMMRYRPVPLDPMAFVRITGV